MMKLTEREEQVIDALAVGMRDKEIAWRLGISPHTVRSHVRILVVKLGANTRAHAVVIWSRGERNGLAENGDTG